MRPGHNLVLTGFMGTGKTAVGHELALKLDMEFVDTDALIESRHGPIPRIFEESGEAAFRAIERTVATELGQQSGLVIATGGRMVLDTVNLRELSRNGRIFCLVATPEEIRRRVMETGSIADRPLLDVDDPGGRIVELMDEREEEYLRFPRVGTDDAAPDAIADEVAGLWHGLTTSDIPGPSGSCSFVVGAGILPLTRQLASVTGSMVVVTDEVVEDLYGRLLGDFDLTIVLPSGGGDETLDAVEFVHRRLRDAGVDETTTLVSLGSSGVVEVAGRAAGTYLHGLGLVHCPTSLIAMIDTSIGADHHPKAVVADVATLQTVPRQDFLSDLVEVVKLGLVVDGPLLGRIEQQARDGKSPPPRGMLAGLVTLVDQAVRVRAAVGPV